MMTGTPSSLPAPVMGSEPRLGVVLFAHGSRDPLWFKPLEAIQQAMAAAHPERHVMLAYLEMASPTLMDAVNTLVEQGTLGVAVLPIFLGVGKHLRADLPEIVQAIKARHAGLEVHLQPAIGEQPGFAHWVASLPLTLSPVAAITASPPS